MHSSMLFDTNVDSNMLNFVSHPKSITQCETIQYCCRLITTICSLSVYQYVNRLVLHIRWVIAQHSDRGKKRLGTKIQTYRLIQKVNASVLVNYSCSFICIRIARVQRIKNVCVFLSLLRCRQMVISIKDRYLSMWYTTHKYLKFIWIMKEVNFDCIASF